MCEVFVNILSVLAPPKSVVLACECQKLAHTATVTISIPRTSVFIVTALTLIMQGIGQGVEP